MITVDIASDLICPWCYIGRARLAEALDLLRAERPEAAVQVAWLPYELNPEMPAAGLYRRAYRSAKFGSWARSQQLDAEVVAAGAAAGVTFNYDTVARTPNTVDGHRLLWLARGEAGAPREVGPQGPAVQDALSQTLFRAYFAEGQDLNDHAVLTAAAAACGLDAERVAAFLASTEGTAAVQAQEAAVRRTGLNGVPFLIFNNQYAVSGAQPADMLLAVLRRVLDEAAPLPAPAPTAATDECADGMCSVSPVTA